MSGKKVSIILSDELMERVDNYLYGARVRKLSDAVRQLIEMGLDSFAAIGTPEEPACQSRDLTPTESRLLMVTAELSADQADLLLVIANELLLADSVRAAARSSEDTRESRLVDVLAGHGLFATIERGKAAQ